MSIETNPALVAKDKKSLNQKIDNTSFSKGPWEDEFPKNQRHILLRQLQKAIASGPLDRLEAIAIADQWGHVSILPILRIGLKDSDSRVMIAAAKALEKHRGKTIPTNQGKLRPPRNVSLTR